MWFAKNTTKNMRNFSHFFSHFLQNVGVINSFQKIMQIIWNFAQLKNKHPHNFFLFQFSQNVRHPAENASFFASVNTYAKSDTHVVLEPMQKRRVFSILKPPSSCSRQMNIKMSCLRSFLPFRLMMQNRCKTGAKNDRHWTKNKAK